MGEKNWYDGVPAPFDADGNVVPLTTRTLYDEDGRDVEVGEVSLVGPELNGDWVWCVRTPGGVARVLNLLHVERPDSWERLEADVERLADCYDVCDYFKGTERKDHDCDHEDGFCCDLCVARDILRRSKALVASGRYRFVDEYGVDHDVEEVFGE